MVVEQLAALNNNNDVGMFDVNAVLHLLPLVGRLRAVDDEGTPFSPDKEATFILDISIDLKCLAVFDDDDTAFEPL
ncbi:hypothetical protein BLOT_002934 [Blomia tropicalis]|nr:hypothetical protein BLOT_002934 [Blomia tropicalis]